MTELRYNPLLGDYTMVAGKRQNRPNLPEGYCPFCPGSGKVPDAYDVHIYDNDFPALSQNPPVPDDVATGLYQTAPSYGKCEVILYSSEHHTALPHLSISHIRKVVDLWADRYAELAKNPQHKYVFIFENRGREIGATMPHPHGQIYAYPYIPQKLRVELENCAHHQETTGHCLLCDMNQEEQSFAKRILVENDHFVSYVPFFTDYPYGAFIVSKSHKTNLTQFTDDEKSGLAEMLKWVTAGMETMFNREFPYMMVLHQSPVNGPDVSDYYHFHIEFYPPLQNSERLKYLASSESGAWAPCNPMAVEDTASFLRKAIELVKENAQTEGGSSK